MQGLANLGFTCAINSLIQIICRNNLMRDTIINYEIYENSLLTNLKEVLVLMHVNNKSIIPRKLVTKLYSIFGNIFNYGEQIDITELWIFINQKIISEIGEDTRYYNLILDFENLKLNNKNIINGILYDTETDYKTALFNSKFISDKFSYEYMLHNENKISKWQQITQGFVLNITTCKKCDNSLYNFEPFYALYLNFPKNAESHSDKNITIVNMIRELFIDDNHNNDWICDNCKCKTDYTKSMKIWRLPDILFVIINRFIDPNIKNDTPVDINPNICFDKGTVLFDLTQDKNYKLASIALHSGNVSGGHYTAICKTDETFLLYDDTNIFNADKFLENNKNVYMLSYSLVL